MSVVASLNSHLFHVKKVVQVRPSMDNVLEIREVSVEGLNPRITSKKRLSSLHKNQEYNFGLGHAIDESRNS